MSKNPPKFPKSLAQSLLDYAIWNATSPFDGEHPNDINWQLSRDEYWDHDAYKHMNEIYGKGWFADVAADNIFHDGGMVSYRMVISLMILIEREWVILIEEKKKVAELDMWRKTPLGKLGFGIN